MNNHYKIGLAGCGKMGTAMVRGWISSGLLSHVDILDPNGLPAELTGKSVITGCTDEASFGKFAKDWDLLVIAIKPQIMEDFCVKIAPMLPPSLPILSIAAGQTIGSFQKRLGDRPVIRSMPNTPAAIGKGMTVACASPDVENNVRNAANALLSAMGHVEWTDREDLLDAVTAVSGSGPAYVFYLIEALAEAGTKSGLTPEMSMALARQTVIGAAALAEKDSDTPADILRANVTSPNGTTAAALATLMDGRWQALMDEAVAKATARSKELSK